MVEGGIETGDLRNLRGSGRERPDRGDMVRLMRRRQWHKRFKRRDYPFIDQYRFGKFGPTVNNAMCHRSEVYLAAGIGYKPLLDRADCGDMVIIGKGWRHHVRPVATSKRAVVPVARLGPDSTGSGRIFH